MKPSIFVGDIDEFYCDMVEGGKRWAVWEEAKDTKLLKRFDTEQEAIEFAKELKKKLGESWD